MGLWRSAKEKRILDRLLDESVHALAVQEIERGVRRDGLWAKAVIQSGGDEIRAKLFYLKLLVQHLKDEHYVADRAREADAARMQAQAELDKRNAEQRKAAQALAEAAARSVRIQTNEIASLADALKEGQWLLSAKEYEKLAGAAGATFRTESVIFGRYEVSFRGAKVKLSTNQLRAWFLDNVVPEILGERPDSRRA